MDTRPSDYRVTRHAAGVRSIAGPYHSRMRWLVTVMLLTVLCACNRATPTETVAQPYTCIAPSRAVVSSPMPATPQQRVAVIGDSYTSGSPQGGNGDRRWTAIVTSQLRAHGIDVVARVGAEGGAGYVQGGRHTGEVFADKIAAAVRPNDTLVVFFGSRNDSRASAAQMARATCDTLRNAEIAAPAARLLVIGPPWVDANPPHYILQARDILRDRATELGAQFVDPIADGWFVDRPDLIGTDGVHPTDAGHEYMAQKIEPVIEQQLTAPTAQ